MKSLTLYVSPNGRENASGAESDPLPGLDAARRTVRRRRLEGYDGSVTVLIRDGVYRVKDPIVWNPDDSPAPGRRIRYAAFPGEKPVLSGGAPLSGWTLVSAADMPDGMPAQAFGHVWVAALPRREGRPVDIKALFDGEGLLERAHSPRLQSAKEDTEPVAPDVPRGEDPRSYLENHPVYRELRFQRGDMRRWRNLPDVELFLTPRNPWTVNYLGLESVDEERCVAKTTLPATYPITTAYGPAHIRRFYRVENVFEYLDAPGRWVSDTSTGSVYLWPRTDDRQGPPAGVVAPVLTEMLRFEGDLERGEVVRDIELDGLTLVHGDRYRFGAGRRSVQHDWEEEDAESALVRLRGARGIRIANCRLADSGGSGIRLDLLASDNEILGNEISGIGGVGVSLIGYGPGTRDENHHNRVASNHIHHVGRLWWHAAGIFVCQSGHNVICDNLIHHTPYCALVVSGPRRSVFDPAGHRIREGALTVRRDEMGEAPLDQPVLLGFRHARYNTIEHNEVHDAMELLGDGNGIYVSGAGVGNVIARNYVHDISGEGTVSGIRLDDEQFHNLVTENVVHRICGAGILTKNINQIENNIIADCYGPRQYGYLSARHRGPCYGTGMRRNILIRMARPQKEPFWVVDDPIGFLPEVSIDDNLLWDVEEPDAARTALAELATIGKGGRSIAADPLFRDADAGDFRLSADSPALKLGFRPIESWGRRS